MVCRGMLLREEVTRVGGDCGGVGGGLGTKFVNDDFINVQN